MQLRPRHVAALLGLILAALAAAWLFLGGPKDEAPAVAGGRTTASASRDPIAPPPPPAKSEEAKSGPVAKGQPAKSADPAKASGGASNPASTFGRDPKTPLPKTADGRVDFAALGMTGKESGAELLKTEETVHTAPIRYAFAVGETWEVVSFYRQTQAGTGEVWSDPVRWRYAVEREGTFNGAACRVVIVKKLGEDGQVDGRFPASTFYVGRDDHRLIGADLYEVRGGKGKYTKVAYDPGSGPLRAKGSIVPFDLPPNGVEGRVTLGRELPHLEPEAEKAKARFPKRGELIGAGDEAVALSYELPTGGKVRQRWSLGDMRWPVESIGPHRRSYRVR